METCSTTPLRTITALPDNQSSISKEVDDNMEICSAVEIVKEQLSDKTESKELKPTPESKVVKIKKTKIRRSKGEKRRISENFEPTKNNKRKKKEEQPNLESKSLNSSYQEVELVSTDKNETIVDNDSDAENKSGTQIKQKSKQMSAKKSKAVAASCKHTFNVLLQLGIGTLGMMDESLRILKSHNFLNSKYVPIDTLMELISLALDINRRPEVEIDKEMVFGRIVNKLTLEVCSSPKTLKPRQSFGAATSSPVAKVQPLLPSNTQEEQTESVPAGVEEMEVTETSKPQDESIKMEEDDPNVENLEKLQSSVEKSGRNFRITNYFKKLKKTVEERDKNERFSSFTTKTDMTIAPKLGGELTGERREKFEEEFINQSCEVKNIFEQNIKFLNGEIGKSRKCLKFDEKVKDKQCHVKPPQDEKENEDDEVLILSQTPEKKEIAASEPQQNSSGKKRVTLIRVDQPKPIPIIPTVPNPVVSRTKAKLLQFHDNRRPPYWGTWRRKSEAVGPKKPFGKDKLLNYEVDSDDEWEEEEEPGESLHGSDDEKEPEEDYEVDNDFFVPHGYLSDDENPEKESMSPKKKLDLLEKQFTSEQKQKTSKMTPFVFGTFWIHNGIPSEGNLYQDLQIESFQIVPWTTLPIQIEDEEDKKNESLNESNEPVVQIKKTKQKIFPDDEIPYLIKMIHGSPQTCEVLAKKFLHYWGEEKVEDGKRRNLTKVCVLKKIRELATWQDKGRYWQVSKETRKEFGADAEVKSPEKKPQKCFIWKFVRKAEKPGMKPPNPTPNAEPEVVVLDS